MVRSFWSTGTGLALPETRDLFLLEGAEEFVKVGLDGEGV